MRVVGNSLGFSLATAVAALLAGVPWYLLEGCFVRLVGLTDAVAGRGHG